MPREKENFGAAIFPSYSRADTVELYTYFHAPLNQDLDMKSKTK